MKAFSLRILFVLLVFMISAACRLVSGGISPLEDLADPEEPALQVEQADQDEEITGSADVDAAPTATTASGQAYEDEYSYDDYDYGIPEDLEATSDDLCGILPKEIFSPLIGSEMTGNPEPFEDDFLGKGCSYDFGEVDGAAKFLYISLAPMTSFEASEETGNNVTAVPFLPEDAFTVDAADAQQLWAKLDNERALVIAVGDEPQPELALQLAFLLVPLLQSMP
jgi:hypothetical protein